MYVSAENANLLRARKQLGLPTLAINTLGFWIINYDLIAKVWFEQCYPLVPQLFSGALNAPSTLDVRIHVADTLVQVATNIDVSVYNVYFEVIPAGNVSTTFHVATSAAQYINVPWQ